MQLSGQSKETRKSKILPRSTKSFQELVPEIICIQSYSGRGGWNVRGGLKGGSPPVPEPRFANSDSNDELESSEGPGHKLMFANSDSNDDIASDGYNENRISFAGTCIGSESSEESESENLVSNMVSECVALPTLYVENQSKVLSTVVVKCECSNNCHSTADNLSKEDLQTIKNKFVGESLTETKNILLAHLKTSSDVLENIEGFFYKGHEFCGLAFSKLTGVSRYILRKVQEAHKQRLDKFVHRSSMSRKNCPRKVNAMCWFKAQCPIYGQRAPDDILVVLPSWLNVTTFFDMYKQDNPIAQEQIKYSTFCQMVKVDFGPRRRDKSLPKVRFSKYSSHREDLMILLLLSHKLNFRDIPKLLIIFMCIFL